MRMPDAARPSCPPVARITSARVASALVVGLVVAGSVVALPQAASAAEPFSKTKLYGATSGSNGIVEIDRSTGTWTKRIAVPSGAATSLNQLGVSSDGKTVFFTDNKNVYEYDNPSETTRTTTRATGLPTNMGGVDPESGRYWYGGNVSGNDTQLQFTSYDPATHANTGTTITVTASNFVGTNGDLAFDGQGNMYFVKSDSTSGNAQIFRVDAADLAASRSATAEKVGDVISAGTGITSMAFGDDGYLYIAGSGTDAFLQVNPITGVVVQRSNVSAPLLDLGSNALPYTGSVTVQRPTTTFDPGDQFTVTLTGNGVSKNNTATTTSASPTATAGPMLLLPGQPDPYTVTQTPSGTTDPANYSTTWLCSDPATGSKVVGGTGTTGTFTIPAGVASVDCSFTNAVKPRPVATTDDAPVAQAGQPVTIDVVGNDAGDLDPSTLRLLAADGSRVSSLHVPEVGDWSTDTAKGTVTFTPAPGFTGNPAPVTYELRDARGLTASAQVVVTYLPTAADDRSTGHEPGHPAEVDVVANDSQNVDRTSVRLLDAAGDPVRTLTVAGEGDWRAGATDGVVTFTPADDFTGNPTPVRYQVDDGAGHVVTARVTVGYSPVAHADEVLGRTIGEAVTVDVVANDSTNVDRTSVRLRAADGSPVTELAVPHQGTWTVDTVSGRITFTPLDGFTGNPDPVTYLVGDGQGHVAGAPVQVAYAPVAAPDRAVGPTPGAPVVLDVLANDSAGLERTSVRLLDEHGDPVLERVVAGQGTWTVDAGSGAVSFTPERGFTGAPEPVEYTATDAFGQRARSTVTVTYLPHAVADRSSGNALGEPVSVDVVENDGSTLVATSVRLLDAAGKPVTTSTVAGEGTWTVDPTTGRVTFTPLQGFTGNPTAVRYTVADRDGHATESTITVVYAPMAVDDASLDHVAGETVTVDVTANDSRNVDPGTVRLLGADRQPVRSLVVAGQGTWTVDPATGRIPFTPEADATRNPTPVEYMVWDASGDAVSATVTVAYRGAAEALPAADPADPAGARPSATDPGAPGKLAFTGAELLWPGIGALVMLAAGGVLLLARRRRQGGRHV